MVTPDPVAAEVYTVSRGLYRALAIQPQFEMAQEKIIHRLPAILKIRFIVADDNHVIHIAYIPLGAQLMLRELVCFIQVQISEHLARKVADWHPDARLPLSGINVNPEKATALLIVNDAAQELQQVAVLENTA